MTNVSFSQLSIARHYGRCTYQGDSYTYLPHTDELIRDDVLKWQQKQKRAAKRLAARVAVDGDFRKAETMTTTNPE